MLLQHQKDYDIKVIKTVFDKFEKEVQSKLFLKSEDAFSIRIVPQQGSPIDSYEYGNLLSLDLSTVQPQKRVVAFREFKQLLDSRLSKLYDKAKFSENKKDYNGVDIWQYFNESLEYDLNLSKLNTLVILSDGYFDFESYPNGFKNGNKYTSTSFIRNLRTQDWKSIDNKNNYGLIPINKFNDYKLNVIVAGVRSKPFINFLDETNVVKYFWKKWLNEMDVKKITVVSYANSPSVYSLISRSI